MHKTRTIKQIIKSIPTLEGAGVHLNRVFGFNEVPRLDPFLLLDDFHSSHPADYLKGFPWHPHRGIETISYVLEGAIEHGDSMGNTGVIGAGDVQWMTAGSGIVHQEMPRGDKNSRLWGFQLWANLPASHKMMKPRYQEIKSSSIPVVKLEQNVQIRIICGAVGDVRGPVTGIVTNPSYLDISVPSNTAYVHTLVPGHTAFAYVVEGAASFAEGNKRSIDQGHLVVFDDGDAITVTTQNTAVRFLLISGKPLNEPVAWYGPIVMNTQAELEQAFAEYENGTFLKQ